MSVTCLAPDNQVLVQVNVPEIATKRLKFRTVGDKRFMTCSSNWLPLFNFNKGDAVTEAITKDGKGLVVKLADASVKKAKSVYGRIYKRRKNNPFETLVEVSSQKLIDKVFPKTCDSYHVTFTNGYLYFYPVRNRLLERVASFMGLENKKSIFSVCSSGMDAYAAEQAGWKVEAVIDYRPEEARDLKTGRDLTESGLLNALSNVAPKFAFNEDIYSVSPDYIKHLFGNLSPALMTVSLQCDDFSSCKNNAQKEKDVESLSTTIDMAYPVLKMIEKLGSPMVLLEQIVSFGTSAIGSLWDVALRRMGYRTFKAVLDPREHGGLTSRKRFFHFATSLPSEFQWPTKNAMRDTPIWDEIIVPHLESLRDVTDTSSMQKGLECGRLRTITPSSTFAPSILKSQPRQAKDSCVIKTINNRILWPSEELTLQLMGADAGFNLNTGSKEIGSEIIGQGVDMIEYRAIISQITKHVESYLSSEAAFAA